MITQQNLVNASKIMSYLIIHAS